MPVLDQFTLISLKVLVIYQIIFKKNQNRLKQLYEYIISSKRNMINLLYVYCYYIRGIMHT